jgi:hypothetical protein
MTLVVCWPIGRMKMQSKRFRRHSDIKVMFLSAEFRLKFHRNLTAFVAAHPEFTALPSKDQRYIIQ